MAEEEDVRGLSSTKEGDGEEEVSGPGRPLRSAIEGLLLQ